ncbi:MAG: dolichyl-phosphate beta-glucosyltransferase [Patescibacteria group bacterium]
MQISVVIPCYNESTVINQTLDRIATFFANQNLDYEIIVVDDGSTDQTLKILINRAEIKLLTNNHNKGKGYTVKIGCQAASGEIILFTDADLSTPIEEFNKLKKYLNEFDIVIGSRALPDSNVVIKQPWYKRNLGILGNKLIQLILGLGIKDTQCGFKIFKRDVLDIFNQQTIDRWGFDFELLYLAEKKGYKIKEVGVRWLNDPDTKVKAKDYFKTLVEVLKVRINDRQGKYS